MEPNVPVYVLLDIGVLLKAFEFINEAADDARKYTALSFEQLANANCPIDIAFGKLAVVRLEQLANALVEINVADGKYAVVRLVHLKNA